MVAVCFRTIRDDLGAAGADRTILLEEASEGICSEARLSAILSVIGELNPKHILFPETAICGADLGRRTAAALEEDAATLVRKLVSDRVVCRTGEATRDLVRPLARVMLLLDGVAKPISNLTYEARPLAPPKYQRRVSIVDLGLLSFQPSTIPVDQAEFIVSAGAGVKDWATFHKLVEAFGAAAAGSRIVVDQGHLPRDCQIGSSGRTVTARVYLALGISGAPQHLQGISDCEFVIAVNSDPNCAMMKRADLAIAGDVQAIMPKLIELLEQRTGPE